MENVATAAPQAAFNPHAAGTAVTEAPDSLRAMLIPYAGGQAVLPNSLVVEVLPYAPSLGIENAPRWVIGSMLWKAQPLPLVSLEYLATAGADGDGEHNRIIVVQAINNHPKLRYFGLVGSEAPRMLELDREQISRDTFLTGMPSGVSSQVLVEGQPAIVPDLDDIENTLSRIVNAARAL